MNKRIKKSTFIYLSLSMIALFIGKNHAESYWNSNNISTNRAPSSLERFEGRDPILYSDFFGSDKKMRVEFWTDKDDQSIKKRGRLALHQAIAQTLQGSKTKDISKEIFKKNVIESFSNHFLKSLYLLKIANGTFQIDLHFEPSQAKTFNDLMNSNQLVDQSETGSLLGSLEERPKSFSKKILSRIPQNQEVKYHPLGGSITLWFKILDLSWNPIDPIPNPSQNAVKGFVKYRRYFSMKRDWTPRLKIVDKKMVLGKWESGSNPNILTVDITNPFNLTSLIPRPGKLEVFYGKIKYPKKYETGFIKNIDLFSKDTTVNKLLLKGDDFSFHLKKLEFNLSDQTFSQNSKIKSYGNWGGFSLGQKRSFKSKTRRSLLGKGATDLIKQFSLYRFEEQFKKVGEK